METLFDFKRRIRKITGHRVHKIRNSYGVYDGYKFYRKYRPRQKEYVLTESQYFSIIRQVNQMLAEEISKGNVIRLPERMGEIELRKYNSFIRLDDQGKIKTNLPIDWESTMELWYNDKQSYNDKTLVRIEEPEIFKIVYNKELANYNNKIFYEFTFTKELRMKTKQEIKAGNTDAPYIGRKLRW